MSRDLTNPLASIVSAARKELPSTTGATARAQAERDRPKIRVVLADVSASMAEPASGQRKVDVLQDALRQVPDDVVILAFSSSITRTTGHLPSPCGGTALHLALDAASQLGATDVLVISDGHPDSRAAALASADGLRARIDVLYCGPENDLDGMAFMRRLARGGGCAKHGSFDAPLAIAASVRTLLIEGPK